MSTSTGMEPRRGWRLLERAGYGAGCVAGCAALLLLWALALTTEMRRMFASAERGRRV